MTHRARWIVAGILSLLSVLVWQMGFPQQWILGQRLVSRAPFLEHDLWLGWKNVRDFTGSFPAQDPVHRIMYRTDREGNRLGDPERAHAEGPITQEVWVVGDSTPFGFGVEAAQAFPARLGHALDADGVRVRNYSVIGYRAYQIRRLLHQKLRQAAVKPSAIIIWAGFNDTNISRDYLRASRLPTLWGYDQQMSRVLKLCHAQGIHVILTTLPSRDPDAQLERINEWIRSQQGMSERITVVDVEHLFAQMNDATLYAAIDDLLPFHIHPSGRGHAVVSELLLPAVREALDAVQSQVVEVPCVPRPLMVFPTIYPPSLDSVLLCQQIHVDAGMEVLDVGTGSGIQALAALQQGASRVVATDVNPQALANARYNAKRLRMVDQLELRLVSLDDAGAYAVIRPHERFDLVISNAPWFDAAPRTMEERIAFDEGHQLVRSLFAGLSNHLKPGGRLLLGWWGQQGWHLLRELAAQYQLQIRTVYTSEPITAPEEEWATYLARLPDDVRERLGQVMQAEVGEDAFRVMVVEVSPSES